MPKDTTPDPEVAQAAKDAVAKSDTITFRWNDEDWTVPASSLRWPRAAAEAAERSQSMVLLPLVLGPVQTAKFDRGKRSTFEDAVEFVGTMYEAMGLSVSAEGK